MEAAGKTLCFVPAGGPLLYENITFVYNSEQLNGTQRVLLDNVLSKEQCRELHSVASVRTGKGEPSVLAQLEPRVSGVEERSPFASPSSALRAMSWRRAAPAPECSEPGGQC